MSTKQQDSSVDEPTRLDRVISEVAWYTPEIAAGTVAGLAASAVWSPLALVSAVSAGLIVFDRVKIARSNRAAKAKAAAIRERKRRQQEAAARDGSDGPETSVDSDRWEELA